MDDMTLGLIVENEGYKWYEWECGTQAMWICYSSTV